MQNGCSIMNKIYLAVWIHTISFRNISEHLKLRNSKVWSNSSSSEINNMQSKNGKVFCHYAYNVLFVFMFGKKEQYNDVGHWSKQNQNVEHLCNYV